MPESNAVLNFESISFSETESAIKCSFLKIFQFILKKEDLSSIGRYKIERNAIFFEGTSMKKAEKKFNFLLYKGFQDLTNTLTKKPTTYIHSNSGIPLIGTTYFGLVDRNTNIIEVRTITGCNIDCVYCSVDEKQRSRDFIVEKDYLIDEFKKLVAIKSCDNIEAHINPQADPFLYADFVPMINDLHSIQRVKIISVNTNATFLTEKLIDELAKAGLTRINFSINTFRKELAHKMAGAQINISRIKDLTEYASKKMDINIAPVYMHGWNDEDLDELIQFAKKLQTETSFKVKVGIQNFLVYKHSKKPVKQVSWVNFYKMLDELEKKYEFDMKPDFGIVNTKPLPLPFRKGDLIEAEVKCDGRFPGEKIAVAKDRSIVVRNCHKEGKIRVKLTRSKDNIFVGVLA